MQLRISCVDEEGRGFDKFLHLAVRYAPGAVLEDGGRECLAAQISTPAGVTDCPDALIRRLVMPKDLMCEPARVSMMNLRVLLRRAGLGQGRCAQRRCAGKDEKKRCISTVPHGQVYYGAKEFKRIPDDYADFHNAARVAETAGV
ncbi:MAG TPA: hypothetical protein VF710_15065 [Longimicrobium sp.]